VARGGFDIPRQRLHNQYITRPFKGTPAELVKAMGAVQGQEYPFAKWGLGLRLGRTMRDASLEAAFDAGEILRTHVMRPTWHFVAADDVGWMQALTAERVLPVVRRQGIEPRVFTRATTIVERALAGHRYHTRPELRVILEKAGIPLTPREMNLVMLFAELEGVVCSGPRREKQFTYALVSERAPNRRTLSRDEALAELTRRFFSSHGPATVRDFVWWSGLRTSDARRGLQMIGARSFVQDGLTYWIDPVAEPVAARRRGTLYLLPIYDEYLVAYRDRIAVPHGPSSLAGASSVFTTFQHAVIIDGQVAATWRVDRTHRMPVVRVTPLRRLAAADRRALEAEAARYGRFTGTSVSLSIG
jgi:hypothetical protein